jgi:hypothetical protein
MFPGQSAMSRRLVSTQHMAELDIQARSPGHSHTPKILKVPGRVRGCTTTAAMSFLNTDCTLSSCFPKRNGRKQLRQPCFFLRGFGGRAAQYLIPRLSSGCVAPQLCPRAVASPYRFDDGVSIYISRHWSRRSPDRVLRLALALDFHNSVEPTSAPRIFGCRTVVPQRRPSESSVE